MKDRYYKVPADVRRYTEICDSRPYQIDGEDNTSWLVYRRRQYHRLIAWRLNPIQEAVLLPFGRQCCSDVCKLWIYSSAPAWSAHWMKSDQNLACTAERWEYLLCSWWTALCMHLSYHKAVLRTRLNECKAADVPLFPFRLAVRTEIHVLSVSGAHKCCRGGSVLVDIHMPQIKPCSLFTNALTGIVCCL